ncbi:MAG TPA: class I SAM-dependent methyltransferase [Gaiellaceae bacterium]
MTQFHFTPARYCEWIRADVPRYDELQDEVARATEGVRATSVLDLGVGTGETATRVLARHPGARLTGIDESPEMLAAAADGLDGDLRVGRLEDALPDGPFDLVISALAVHHLDGAGKRDLFRRIAAVLAPGGRFVLGDVVLADVHVTPTTPGYDRPDTVDDQLAWLRETGLDARVTYARDDLAVLSADARTTSRRAAGAGPRRAPSPPPADPPA